MGRRDKGRRRYAAEPSAAAVRPPNPEQALADLEQVEGLGLRAAIELRGLGLNVTADALCDLLDRVRHIRCGVVAQLREAAEAAEERALLDGIAAMVDDEMREAGL